MQVGNWEGGTEVEECEVHEVECDEKGAIYDIEEGSFKSCLTTRFELNRMLALKSLA